MKPPTQSLFILVASLLAGGCGTIADGDGARLDHWGPIPVLCLGACEVLDPYYYDREEKAALRGEGETTPASPQPSAATQTAEPMLAPKPNLPPPPAG